MNTDCLKEALLPLKESSRSAISDAMGESFDDLKEYLHLERNIEKELFSLLRMSAEENSKRLILVCGNVGDGKSHLLSRISKRHKDIMGKFKVLNDATESYHPEKSNIDTLKLCLSPFSDDRLAVGNEMIVLAMLLLC